MKVSRSKSGSSYKLTFEFDGVEALLAGIADMDAKFKSFKTTKEAVKLLMRLTGIDRVSTAFEDLQEQFAKSQTQQSNYKTYDPFKGFNRKYTSTSTNWSASSGASQTRTAVEPKWCKVLGLKQTATKDEIKTAYRKLVKINHPDKGGDAKKFSEISSAYDEAMK